MIGARLFQRRDRLTPEGHEIADSGLFDLGYYSERSGARFTSLRAAINHFLAAASACDPHPLFSMYWYRKEYPDAAGFNPFVHFLRHGAQAGKSPSAYFDPRFYLDTYPDVVAARVNALSHYLDCGAGEGRDPSAWFSTSDYLAAHADVAAAGLNPLVHFARYGEAEGRKLSDRTFKLDARYGMPEPDFARWRTRAVGRRRKSRPPSCLRQLVVVPSGATPVDEAFWVGLREATAALGISLMSSPIGDVARLAERVTPASLVLFIESGDRLDRAGHDALLASCPEEADLVVFDMFYRHDGSVYPVLQPGANPQYIRSANSVFSRFAVRGRLLRQIVGGDARDARAVFLAALDRLEAGAQFGGLHHVAAPILETPSLEATIRERRQQLALAAADAARKSSGESVSVILSAKGNGARLDRLLAHLTTSCVAVTEILVLVETTDPIAEQTLQRWDSHRSVVVIRPTYPFNSSDQRNVAGAKASGTLLLFLSDDVIGDDAVWLDRLIEAMAEPGVGLVGPRLLRPDKPVQDAGLYLGFHGTAGHIELAEDDYLFMATSSRDVSCVAGTALLMRRSIFEDLGGFDAQLGAPDQDIDLCQRVRGLDHRILFVPAATLHSQASIRVTEPGDGERTYFQHLYEDGRLGKDRFHNAAYDVNDESLHSLVKY